MRRATLQSGAGVLSADGAPAHRGHGATRRRLLALGAVLSLLAAMSFSPALARAEVCEEPQLLIQSATAIARTSATLNALVNPNGSAVEECELEYGTSKTGVEKGEATESAPCSPNPGSGEILVAVAAEVSGLKEGTTYWYRVTATNEFGTSSSGLSHFTTPPTAPKATIENASSVARNTATLHGLVNPEDSNVEECYFQVATSLAYESPSTVHIE